MDLSTKFTEIYQKQALNAFFAPGRINLIGEHIDYNGGLVLPCAIEFGTTLYTAPNNDNVIRLKSLNFDEVIEIPLQNGYTKQGDTWYNFPLGVADYFIKNGHTLQGLDMLYYGNIPIASGLSSSASIEVVTAYAFNELFNAGYSKLDLVKFSKSVENNFIGVNSGIMDQFAVTFGEKDKAMAISCDTLDYNLVSAQLGDYVLAVVNTNKPRKLVESKYNERVEECAAALKAFRQRFDIEDLCDIDAATFAENGHLIADETVYKRAQHVILENERVKQSIQALSQNKLAEFGQLMYASHQSLRDLYEVSGIELDAVVDYSKTNPDVAGARMTGAGFGGCAIALVKKAGFDNFSKEITAYYTQKIGYAPTVYQQNIGNGVGSIQLLSVPKQNTDSL
ncbi:galactokinase [Mucilaginibacter auburnensis]|uniref:Galactokinase n=1 Tax=Mucilaginibacter auburnensis TaxID=1457233 RepID=A0A2H9VVC3_9SPHI|nr:galactokinase [Mucilaginibacter auburnensis]PJJ84767.1 galactokinase [Mucilaginibacter auburnensis]